MLVSLVGAGPGDPGLLTLKGKNALQAADVVIYDALANAEFLRFAPEKAEKIYVGKIADQHALPQEGINRLLVQKARENGGQNVVRLKGGDPCIFGRGGEEALFLYEAGIPFEIVPGITSAIAAPAYAGIPLTHRGYNSALTILTGHENPDKEKSAINWKAVANSDATLVFVMGMKNLRALSERLTASGIAPDLPCAVVYKGTTPFQRSVFATVSDIADKVEKAGIGHPAIMVVGKVVELAKSLDWFSQKPLLGRTIVVTRAREQASEISARLVSLGANVIQCPSIKIVPMPDYAELDSCINQLSRYKWLIFTSVNGVRYFWNRLLALGMDSRALSACKIAAIGSATGKALEKRGIMPDLLPDNYIAEDVARTLIAREGSSIANCSVLLPRALDARMALPDMLAEAGAIVDVVPVYKTVREADNAGEVIGLLKENGIDCISFGSSSTVENFLDMVGPDLLLNSCVKLAAIGPVTAEKLKSYGLNADIVPENYTIPDLIRAITACFQKYGEK